METRGEILSRAAGHLTGEQLPPKEVYGDSLSPALMGEYRIRAALSLASQGDTVPAGELLRMAPTPGEYLPALHALATAYLHLARRERIDPQLTARLEQGFWPLRGAWGGLGLAAYGYACAGQMGRCRQLLDREAECVHAEELDRMLPLLAAWRATVP